ncbi:MAG: radical SAM protein [Halioglobus sp.]
MLTPKTIELFDRFRDAPYGTPVCAAPAMNLHFSQLGVVTACCFNRSQVLGIYPQNSVTEIWHGEPVKELREALSGYDLTKGCEKCAHQIEAADFGGSHAIVYSHFSKISIEKRKEWGMHPDGDPDKGPMPMRMEFNIHNACNLQCSMCHGLASSAIRAHREKLPPLANPYDEAFVDQLEPFLPYVVEMDFMGGEPFMIPVYQMLWERITRVNPLIKVCILTNGTILNDSIKELLEGFNCWMHVSIDSIKKETYESIRKGASFDLVMENCDYYSELMKKRGLPFMFRYCPMRQNWRELPETIQYCNDRDISIMFNQVDSPLNFSLHTLPTHQLQAVVSFLRKNAPPEIKTEAGVHNQTSYVELIHRLEGFLDKKSRINGLKVRLDVSDTVIGQYTKSKKTKVAKGVTVPLPDEEKDPLVKAAKRFVTTRLNVEQALRTEDAVPEEFIEVLDARFTELNDLRSGTDEKIFVQTFLSELIRTYSSLWGVLEIHATSVFDTVERLAELVAEHPDTHRIVSELLNSRPGELYDSLSSQSAENVMNTFTREQIKLFEVVELVS